MWDLASGQALMAHQGGALASLSLDQPSRPRFSCSFRSTSPNLIPKSMDNWRKQSDIHINDQLILSSSVSKTFQDCTFWGPCSIMAPGRIISCMASTLGFVVLGLLSRLLKTMSLCSILLQADNLLYWYLYTFISHIWSQKPGCWALSVLSWKIL